MKEFRKNIVECDNFSQHKMHFKKVLCLLLSLATLFSITSVIPITAEAATQNALWFMDDLKITQVPGGDYSHKGTQNFDVVGVKNNNIKAPFDCKIVKIHKGEKYGNTVIIESINKVLYADGATDYMSMCFAHDNDISDLSVGKTLKQGQVFYQTGTYGNAKGRHSHITVIKGKYKNDMWTKNSYGNYCSPNAIKPTKGLFITDKTNVVDTKGLSFKKAKNSSTTKPTVKNPSVTVNSAGNLTTNSVKLNFTANNPSKVTIKKVGVQVRKKGTSEWKTKSEAMNSKYTNASSVKMWWTVGSKKEFNISLSAGTTYEYRAYVVYNNKNYYSSTSTFTTKSAVKNPSVTVNAVTNLAKKSVQLNFTANNPSKVTIKKVGVQVRKKGTSEWKTKSEAMNSKYTNATSVKMWWTVGSKKELNMSLSAGTTYEYRAYVVYNNKNYYSTIKTFTTKK